MWSFVMLRVRRPTWIRIGFATAAATGEAVRSRFFLFDFDRERLRECCETFLSFDFATFDKNKFVYSLFIIWLFFFQLLPLRLRLRLRFFAFRPSLLDDEEELELEEDEELDDDEREPDEELLSEELSNFHIKNRKFFIIIKHIFIPSWTAGLLIHWFCDTICPFW